MVNLPISALFYLQPSPITRRHPCGRRSCFFGGGFGFELFLSYLFLKIDALFDKLILSSKIPQVQNAGFVKVMIRKTCKTLPTFMKTRAKSLRHLVGVSSEFA